MLFKEMVDARTPARTDAGRRTLKDHKSSLEHFVLRWAKNIYTYHITSLPYAYNEIEKKFIN